MKYVSYKMGNAHHSSIRVNLLVLVEELSWRGCHCCHHHCRSLRYCRRDHYCHCRCCWRNYRWRCLIESSSDLRCHHHWGGPISGKISPPRVDLVLCGYLRFWLAGEVH
jgi:hypothetical protein